MIRNWLNDLLTWLSRPRMRIMMKKRMAHKGATGSWVTAFG